MPLGEMQVVARLKAGISSDSFIFNSSLPKLKGKGNIKKKKK